MPIINYLLPYCCFSFTSLQVHSRDLVTTKPDCDVVHKPLIQSVKKQAAIDLKPSNNSLLGKTSSKYALLICCK